MFWEVFLAVVLGVPAAIVALYVLLLVGAAVAGIFSN